MKKNLYFIPYTFVSIKAGVIISKLLEDRNEGKINQELITCLPNVKTCALNPTSNLLKCKACRETADQIKKNFGLNQLSIDKNKNKNQINTIQSNILEVIRKSKSMDEIKSIEYNSSPLGFSIVSSFVSMHRTTLINKNSIKILIELAKAYMNTYDRFVEILKTDLNIESLTLFNGRLEITNAAWNAAKHLNRKVEILEVTGIDSKIINFGENDPFSIEYNTKEILRLWIKERKNNISISSAHDFYKKKLQGLPTNDVSYTSTQSSNLMPKNWKRRNAVNVVIFGSSMDEFYSIGKEWDFPFFKTQADGVFLISDMLKIKNENINIYYRMHPNLAYLDNPEITNELKLDNLENVTVIPPESKISTYKMMKESDLVITFGSTIGIEALYHSKNAIMIGKSFYMNLPGVVSVKSKEELADALNMFLSDNFSENEFMRNKAQESALMFANFIISSGYRSNLINIENNISIVNGIHIRPTFKNRVYLNFAALVEMSRSYNSTIIRFRNRNNIISSFILRLLSSFNYFWRRIHGRVVTKINCL